MPSDCTPNSILLAECFDVGKNFKANGVITANGNSAGNTLCAHTASPPKKLSIKSVGALRNNEVKTIKSNVIATFKYFTTIVYSHKTSYMFAEQEHGQYSRILFDYQTYIQCFALETTDCSLQNCLRKKNAPTQNFVGVY